MSAKRKTSAAKFAPPSVKPAVKVPSKSTIDESRTAVSATDNVQSALKQQAENDDEAKDAIEISSDAGSSDSDEEADSDDAMGGVEGDGREKKPRIPKANGADASASTAAARLTSPSKTSPAAGDHDADSDADEDATSPSFGEILRGTIDVPAILSQQPDGISATPNKSLAAQQNGTSRGANSGLAPPSLSSLSTVLTQALRTEDIELLESCLQVNNVESVQQTVERLDSALAGVLLSKLAARFHRRPGRAGGLMAWVKWTLVAHGGALAVQPKVLERLVGLQKVLNERSRGLPSLLALKGKLDMLDAQMQLRQARQRRRTGAGRRQGDGVEDDEEDEEDEDDEDDEDDEGIIYVEGEQDDDDDDIATKLANAAHAELDAYSDDEVSPTNGFAADSDVDDDEDVDVDDDDSDDAAEEDLDEDEVDHEDVEDSMDDEDDSDAEAAAPPTKVQKTARSFGKRR